MANQCRVCVCVSERARAREPWEGMRARLPTDAHLPPVAPQGCLCSITPHGGRRRDHYLYVVNGKYTTAQLGMSCGAMDGLF